MKITLAAAFTEGVKNTDVSVIAEDVEYVNSKTGMGSPDKDMTTIRIIELLSQQGYFRIPQSRYPHYFGTFRVQLWGHHCVWDKIVRDYMVAWSGLCKIEGQ